MQKILKFLQFIALLEAVSWLALLGAMFFKYVLKNDAYIRPIGSVHGFLFIAFVALVLTVGIRMKWTLNEIIWSLLSSFPPCCTILADYKIFRKYIQK